jgi:serine/threonine protein kinase
MKRLFQGGLFLLYETTPKIIHGDLKEENILCKYNETFTNIYDEIKLIDWGLSFTYDITNPRQAIQYISRRPLQFNLPFGILLFSNYFYREYNSLVLIPLKTNPGKLVELVRRFCDTYYNDSFFKNGRDDSKPDSLKDFNEFVYKYRI